MSKDVKAPAAKSSRALVAVNPLSQRACKAGVKCEYHKLGKCKFQHGFTPTNAVAAARLRGNRKSTIQSLRANAQLAPLVARISEMKRSMSIIKDGYVDSKASPALQDQKFLATEYDMLRSAARSLLGNNEARMILYASNNANGSTGAALAGSIGLSPSTTSEWSTVAALYDECKVSAIVVQYAMNTTASAPGTVEFAVGYDSTRNFAPTSVNDVQESIQHEIGILAISNASTAEFPASNNGYRKFHIKQQTNPVANGSAVTGGNGIVVNFPGEWFDTSNAAALAYTVGYFRHYSTALASTTMQIKYNLAFHCTFRERT